MSSGKGKSHRRARPAQTDREARARWGFAGAAVRGELAAYTGEHFEKDVKAGIIPVPERGCPAHRPERECQPLTYPTFYRCVRMKRLSVVGPPPDDTHKPKHHRRHDHMEIGERWIQLIGAVCFDCRLWLEWLDHQAFFLEFGDHGLGDMRPNWATRMLLQGDDEDERAAMSTGEFLKACDEIDQRERHDLFQLAGAIETQLDWYEARLMLRTVRHCLTRYVLVISST